MDVAYDHTFTDDAVTGDNEKKGKAPAVSKPQEDSLNEELQQAYRAISNSPWGARFGAFVGNVRKQGESYYETARKEYPAVAEQAAKGFGELRTNLVARTRALSLSTGDKKEGGQQQQQQQQQQQRQQQQHEAGLLEKIKKGASQRIAEIEAVEARADEYLVKFGSSIGGFLRDAITISPPAPEAAAEAARKEGDVEKKQIFTRRLDAQLHLLHTNLELFRADPPQVAEFEKSFNVEKETERVAADLDRYPELRATMEKLVPGEVEYKKFWIRYYFLRNELDEQEKMRKELLKGAAIEEEEVGWDDDEEDEADDEGGEEEEDDEKAPTTKKPAAKASTDTLQPTNKNQTSSSANDRGSQSDSEASYDVVSGAPSKTPSQAAGSPPKSKVKDVESSDEEADWE